MFDFEYTYDNVGNIKTIKENGTNRITCNYDGLNQLVDVKDTVNNNITFYSYDDGGNITNVLVKDLDNNGEAHNTISSVNYTYDTTWKDKLTAYDGQPITYDSMGNPLEYRNGLSFTWENGRWLKAVTKNGNNINMQYDINGLRTKKGTTKYYYDTDNNLIAMVASPSNNNTLLFYYDSDNNPTAFQYNDTMYYYVKNIQGDIIRIVNENGTTEVTYDYDAWGRILSVKNSSGNTITPSKSNLAGLNPFRYRGYVYDDETGLYYLQSRYYDPKTGRFINADILIDANTGSPLSTNMFAYCENCPLYKIDTNGKDAWWIQSPSSANYAGHTSLLIQEKPGYWWYFYWGDKSIQLLFLGTTKAAEINTKVRRIINICNRYSGYRISYDENYTGFLKFHGEFYNTYNAIKRYIDSYCKSRRVTKFQLQVNPDMSGASYRRLLNSTNFNSFKKMLLSATHLKYNGKKRPYSIIVNGNKDYNLLFNNCMQKSAHFLSLGSYKPKGKALLFFSTMYSFSFSRMIPNRAFSTISALRLSY